MTPEQQREAVRLLEAIWKDVLLPPGLAAKVGVFRESLKSTTTPTVRVRAAVEINEQGHWSVCGGYRMSDSDAKDVCHDCVEVPGIVHFIEADIPLPQPQTVRAEVVDG